MTAQELTPELITMVVSIIMSLAFSYIPGLKDLFEKQDEQRKRLVMLVLMVLVGALTPIIGCATEAIQGCDTITAKMIVLNIVYAIMANQSIHALAKPKKDAA